MSDEDRLHRELDRAWDLLESGDVDGAKRIGETLGREADDLAPIPVLLAACAREQDQLDEAMRLLDHAATLEPEWAEPDLRAAEMLADSGDLEKALARVTRCLDKVEDEDELLDATALKAGLELELDQESAARATLAGLPPADVAEPSPLVAKEIGHLHLGIDDAVGARAWFDRAVEIDDDDADAWHGVGLAAELAEDEEAKRKAWLKTLELDNREDAELPVRMTEGEMAAVAETALGELPVRARRLLTNVPILIVDRPARSDVEGGLDPRLLGLFAGSAYSDGDTLGGPPQLTQIFLFRFNLERVAEDELMLREEIRLTLLHETGHFFGMDEDDLDDVGLA